MNWKKEGVTRGNLEVKGVTYTVGKKSREGEEATNDWRREQWGKEEREIEE